MTKLDSAAYFEKLYNTPDPWGINDKYSDKVRATILNDYFRGITFGNGIDVCCGEGVFTDKINFVTNRMGVDISRKAIERARGLFPEIEFKVGDFFELDQMDKQFSFVSCFEALYYPESDASRERALLNILKLGGNDAYYAFSVVTVGTNAARRYFTKDSFIALLEKYFVVEHVSPFVLRGRATILSRLWFRFLMFFNEHFGLSCASEYTVQADDRYVYQHLFIARRLPLAMREN